MIDIKQCIKCGILKEDMCFAEGRNTCKLCRSQKAKEIISKQKEEDIILFKCKEMATDAYSRVFAKSRSYKKGYRNLEEPYGFTSPKEMRDYLYDNFYTEIETILNNNDSPSVDRVDSTKGYTKDNIRVITHTENTLLGVENRKRKVKMITPTNDIIVFDSTSDCVEYFGYSRNSGAKVTNWIRKCNGEYSAYVLPKGYQFEYVK